VYKALAFPRRPLFFRGRGSFPFVVPSAAPRAAETGYGSYDGPVNNRVSVPAVKRLFRFAKKKEVYAKKKGFNE
jgi:hypothetical protein